MKVRFNLYWAREKAGAVASSLTLLRRALLHVSYKQ